MTTKLREIAESKGRDKDYSPHETWCDTQNKISDRCNCMASGYIEKIEELAAALKVACDVIDLQSEALDIADDQMQYYKCELIDNPSSWNGVIERVHNLKAAAEKMMGDL